MRRPLTLVLTLLGLVLGLGVMPTAPAQAADNGSWSVEPTPPSKPTPAPRNYFVLEGDPGSVIEDQVRITNFTKQPITFKLYGADGYNTVQDGFFALKTLDDEQVDVGSWVTMPVSELTVAPLTQVDAPVTITIPENATPGDHAGGIVALNTAIEGTEKGENLEIGVQRAVGARVYLRVSGPTRAALEVSDVTLDHDRGWLPWTGSGKGTVTYTVENTGNLRQSPDIDIQVNGLFGRDVDQANADGKVDLLPGQKVTLTQPIDGIGHLDHLTATVTVETTEGTTDSAETSTWISPWLLIAVVLLLVVGAVYRWRRRRRLMRRGLEEAQLAPKLTVPSPG